jgi:Calcineurin-like phosphoesterase
MTAEFLVRPLFEGPIDIIGDVHGELPALRELLVRLRYDETGRHPEGRRMVFVGDLGDRGPDSPGVVTLVRRFVESGRAQVVLGNHELNALREDVRKPELSWLFEKSPPFRHHDSVIKQETAYHERDAVLRFFRSMPIVLERSDVRIVHACWEQGAVDLIRHERDVLEVYYRYQDWIDGWLHGRDEMDAVECKLAHQNRNPIKLLTSGPEMRLPAWGGYGGRRREEKRIPWWEWYAQKTLCVFGHYWRGAYPGDEDLHLFAGYDHCEPVGPGNAFCVDLSAGKRFKERLRADFDGKSCVHLAALRLPEKVLILDNDDQPRPVARKLRTARHA